MKSNYSIFISYRRERAFETASLIAEKLRSTGYSVFLDVESLRSGKFNEQLYNVIEHCTDFILVLPEGGLDRCAQETDWLRLEILCAIKYRKNIIPVMLKGFVWPETMPAGLEGLNEFQSIAAGGHDYFDASVAKLRGYLESKPVKWNRKRMKGLMIGMIALMMCIGGGYYTLNRSAVSVCREQVDKVTSRMAVINLLVSESKAVSEAWEAYYQEYKQAAPADRAYLNSEIREALSFHRKEVEKLKKDTIIFALDGYQRFMLRFCKVNVTDIEAFHSTLYPSFFDDVNSYINALETWLRMGETPEISLSSNHANLEYIQHSANSAYYAFLEFLSGMPGKTLKSYKELSAYFGNLPSATSIYLPKDEYERLQKLEIEKAQNLLSELGFLNTRESLKLEQEQRELSYLKEKAEKVGTVRKEVQARTQHIAQMTSDVKEKQRLLQETVDKTEEAVKSILEKCKLSKDDEQYVMWGKILRLATVMDNMRNGRDKMKRQNEKDKAEAKAKGYDVSHWFEVSYSITTKDVLKEVLRRLDEYEEFFPGTGIYVRAVKKYYMNCEERRFPLRGMAVMATKDDLPHPVLRLGDIVIARKGMAVNNTDDYKKAKDKKGKDVLTFLRLDAKGRLQERTKVVPPTEVLVGFLMLKEE